MLPIEKNTLSEILRCIDSGHFQRGIDIGLEILATGSTAWQIREYVGYAQLMSRQYQDGISNLTAVRMFKEADPVFLNNLAVAYINTGNLAQAMQDVQLGLSIAPTDPELRYTLALIRYRAQAWAQVIELLTPLLSISQMTHPATLLLAKTYNALRDFASSRRSLEFLIKKYSPNVEVLTEYADCLFGLQEVKGAESAYRSALAVDANDLNALAGLADLYERTNQLNELGELTGSIDWRACVHPKLLLVGAKMLRRMDKNDQALAILKTLDIFEPDLLSSAALYFERGRNLDALSRYDEAYSDFTCANQLTLRDFSNKHPTYNAKVEELTWLCGPPPTKNNYQYDNVIKCEKYKDPVFIVGFPRSGTTLLEQILSAHSALLCMEEKPVLASTFRQYEKSYSGKTLEDLDVDAIHFLQDHFYKNAGRFVELNTKQQLVDKNPFNVTRVGFIKRLFPDAKIVFALRHPCDVILSCFMQNFTVNDGNVGFHSLESAADIYVKTMDRWLLERDSACPSYYQLKYESLTANFNTELSGLFDYLELPWDPKVLHYLDAVKNKKRINTPSYHQVSKPIYTSSVYRWKNYAQYFVPILPFLEKHIQLFGYQK